LISNYGLRITALHFTSASSVQRGKLSATRQAQCEIADSLRGCLRRCGLRHFTSLRQAQCNAASSVQRDKLSVKLRIHFVAAYGGADYRLLITLREKITSGNWIGFL
jgi:hypothetical protein